MKRASVLGILSAVALGVGGAGCVGDASGEGEGAAHQAAQELVQAKVLATLAVSGGRTVTFRQLDPETVLVGEEGPVGQPRDLDSVHGSVLDVYRALSSGAEPPSALVAAAAGLAASRRVAPLVTAAPPVGPAPGSAPVRRIATAGEVSTFCSSANTTQCITGTNQQLTTYCYSNNELGYDDYAQNIAVLAVNTGTKSSTYAIQKWNGSAWAVVHSGTVSTGMWHEETTYSSGKSYWQAYETSTGGSAELGMQSFIPQAYEPEFYPSSDILVVTPYNFVHDTHVNLLLQKGTGYTASRSNLAISSLSADNGVQFACEYDESPYSMTLTLTGVETGQVATATVGGINCYLE